MPKRRFFQIHLSTAVVLMLVAGVLAWANVRERRETLLDGVTAKYHGWPITATGYVSVAKGAKLYDFLGGMVVGPANVSHFVIYWRVGVNIGCAVVALSMTCVACEWRIRRCAARKANE